MSNRDFKISRSVLTHDIHYVIMFYITCKVVISGDGWFYDFGDSNRAFKRDCTVYTGY